MVYRVVAGRTGGGLVVLAVMWCGAVVVLMWLYLVVVVVLVLLAVVVGDVVRGTIAMAVVVAVVVADEGGGCCWYGAGCRYGFQSGVLKPLKPYGLPLEETLLSERLNALGFASHAVGAYLGLSNARAFVV